MITEDNNFVELITLEGAIFSFTGNSTKFTFGGANEPIVTSWMNWITGLSGSNPTATYINNFNYFSFSSDPPTSGFSFSFSSDGLIYKANFQEVNIQISLLLVSPLLSNNISVNNYQYKAQAGADFPKIFTTDFGVSFSDFGRPASSENCLVGLFDIDFHFYRNDSLATYFYFTFNGESIADLAHQRMWGARLNATCFGVCPTAHYYHTNGSCVQCPADCVKCLSSSQCTSCIVNFFRRVDNLCYSTCNVGYYENTTDWTCHACPTSCDFCPDSTLCTTCSSGSFLRTDNLCYSSCLVGFF